MSNLTLPLAQSVSSGVDAFSITNTGSGPAIRAESTGGFTGLYSTSSHNGIVGETASAVATECGVVGRSTGSGKGVYGIGTNGEGVKGESSNGFTGVYGTSGHNGVVGETASAVATECGVVGRSTGGGKGVYGIGTNGEGVKGESSNGFTGVYGTSSHNGVMGETTSNNDSGVVGVNHGAGWGLFASSSLGTGVRGASTGGTTGIGVTGTSVTGSGVAATSSNVTTPSILGRHALPGGVGVVGYNPSTTGDGVGVFGKSDSAQRGDQPAIGVWGYCPQGLAGVFSGDVLADSDMTVKGTLTAATKLFKLDHPLDPANRYLVHACVESFEMINVYSGNVTTDATGDATVSLPGYFQAINTDFRYQLTVIGQFAHAFVSAEIQNNRFAIKTDKPGVKVSWQVTGLRQDNYAKAHSLIAEQEKAPSERGLFLHPELFNEPEEKGLGIPKSRSASIILNYDIK
jgi:hypothetical protein